MAWTHANSAKQSTSIVNRLAYNPISLSTFLERMTNPSVFHPGIRKPLSPTIEVIKNLDMSRLRFHVLRAVES